MLNIRVNCLNIYLVLCLLFDFEGLNELNQKSANILDSLRLLLYQIGQTREVESYLAKVRVLSEDADVALVLLMFCDKQNISKG